MACPDPVLLADLASGQPLSDRDGLLAHVSTCPECLDAVTVVLSLPPEAPRRRLWIPIAAAAALLLAVGVYQGGRPETKPAPAGVLSPSASAPSPFPPAGALEAGEKDARFLVGQATSLTLQAGSRAKKSGGDVMLISGRAWIENPGEPFRILAPGGSVSATEGVLLLEVPQASGFSWLRAAHAAEGAARVVVFRGTARLTPEGGQAVEIPAGQEASLGPQGVRRQAFSEDSLAWKGDGGWLMAKGLPSRLDPGIWSGIPDDLGNGYAWEVLLRRLDPPASAGVHFAAGGHCWELPLGAVLQEAPGWSRIRVEVRSGWVRIQAGSQEVLREPVEALRQRLDSVPGSAGLRVWGGGMELKEGRWRTGI